MKRFIQEFSKIVITIIFLAMTSIITAQSYDYEVVCHGDAGSKQIEDFYIIRNNTEFERLWKKLYCSNKSLPKIEFGAEQIVAIFRGTCSSSGYGIEIKDIVETESDLIINAIYTGTGGARMVITGPFIMLKMKRSDLNVILNTSAED